MKLPPFTGRYPGYLSVGDWTYAGANFRVDHYQESQPTHCTIGRFVCIADDVTILLGGEHRTDRACMFHFPRYLVPGTACEDIVASGSYPMSRGDVTVGNDVWLGYRSTILSGSVIGDGAVVAAGSVVTGTVERYQIVGGVPAKPIRPRFPAEMAAALSRIRWWDWDDATILQRQRDLIGLPIKAFVAKYDI